jgi:signal transduction histidine kinase
MRARAERIAGALTVESEPGGGTAVSARVPLVRHDQ